MSPKSAATSDPAKLQHSNPTRELASSSRLRRVRFVSKGVFFPFILEIRQRNVFLPIVGEESDTQEILAEFAKRFWRLVFRSKRREFRHRLSRLGNHDLFAVCRTLHQAGKLSLCLIDVYLNELGDLLLRLRDWICGHRGFSKSRFEDQTSIGQVGQHLLIVAQLVLLVKLVNGI